MLYDRTTYIEGVAQDPATVSGTNSHKDIRVTNTQQPGSAVGNKEKETKSGEDSAEGQKNTKKPGSAVGQKNTKQPGSTVGQGNGNPEGVIQEVVIQGKGKPCPYTDIRLKKATENAGDDDAQVSEGPPARVRGA